MATSAAYRKKYPKARPKGFASYSPQAKARRLLEQVFEIFEEYREFLPLTVRQIFYRLVGRFDYPKTENAYDSLANILNRARRGGMVPFEYIRDDGVQESNPTGYTGKDQLYAVIQRAAKSYKLIGSVGQEIAIEVWVEAAGMVPLVESVADPYGVKVISSGGFSSVGAVHDAAQRIAKRERQTVILNIGDHDSSGLSIYDSQAEDVFQMITKLNPWRSPDFERIAVTEEQIEWLGLPGSPPKATDKRGDWEGETVQVEAMPPDVLVNEVREAILEHTDEKVWDETVRRSKEERAELIAQLKDLGE